MQTGVPILMDNPKEVGADRIINALAAVELYGGPAIVVDFGTATTFDAVQRAGRVRRRRDRARASRSPSRRSAARGAQLRKIELARPRGGDRQEHGRGDAVRHPLRLRRPGRRRRRAGWRGSSADDPDDVTVIATGGLAPMVLDECAVIDDHEPWLTLIGLGWSSSATPDPTCQSVRRLRPPEALTRRRNSLACHERRAPAPAAEDDLPEQMRVRREKLDRLVAAGVDPYPVPSRARHTTARSARRTPELDADTAPATSRGHRTRHLPAHHRQALLRRLRDGDGDLQVMISLAEWARSRSPLEARRRPRRPRWRRGRGHHLPPRRAVESSPTAGRSRPRRCDRCRTSTRSPTRRGSGSATSTSSSTTRRGRWSGIEARSSRAARDSRRPRVRRGRDADAAARPRWCGGAAVHDPPQRLRPGHVPSHRDRAVTSSGRRRWHRAGLRDRPQLPQRGRRLDPQPRVHDARGLRGLRRLRHDWPTDPRHRARRGPAPLGQHRGRPRRQRDRPGPPMAHGSPSSTLVSRRSARQVDDATRRGAAARARGQARRRAGGRWGAGAGRARALREARRAHPDAADVRHGLPASPRRWPAAPQPRASSRRGT